ncbi:hypothetical protein B0H10DRAFT_1064853 [Mycena sp. CBHHK59/15]|nr:hypothetical protein B0H10DRAFT_1064853 [Mycena sp. CBHHK59/15]
MTPSLTKNLELNAEIQRLGPAPHCSICISRSATAPQSAPALFRTLFPSVSRLMIDYKLHAVVISNDAELFPAGSFIGQRPSILISIGQRVAVVDWPMTDSHLGRYLHRIGTALKNLSPASIYPYVEPAALRHSTRLVRLDLGSGIGLFPGSFVGALPHVRSCTLTSLAIEITTRKVFIGANEVSVDPSAWWRAVDAALACEYFAVLKTLAIRHDLALQSSGGRGGSDAAMSPAVSCAACPRRRFGVVIGL